MSGVPGLVEGADLDLHVRVLAQDLLGVLVGVERVHEHERHVGAVRLVQVLPTNQRNTSAQRVNTANTERQHSNHNTSSQRSSFTATPLASISLHMKLETPVLPQSAVR